jgi:hypothetical protein
VKSHQFLESIHLDPPHAHDDAPRVDPRSVAVAPDLRPGFDEGDQFGRPRRDQFGRPQHLERCAAGAVGAISLAASDAISLAAPCAITLAASTAIT